MDRIILITGASSGIGKTITEYLAGKSYVVFAGARKEKDIDELNKIANVSGVKLDVTKPEEIKQVVQQIEDEKGHLDCLINNAGIMGWGAVIDREMEYYKSVFDVNLWGNVSMVKAAYPLLRKSNNNPVIFNISSQGANYTLPFWSPYMMSKHALEAFTGCVRREFLSEGVRVVSIAPGALKSNMLNSQQEALDKYEQSYKSEFSSKVVKMLGVPIRKKKNRGKSPDIVGELIYRVINNGSRKARYEPGKQFVPDVILQRLPTGMIDKMIMKILSK
ncbi:SDR family NAD(P)-dependent oxidoreductase [Bacteroidota bacterium]